MITNSEYATMLEALKHPNPDRPRFVEAHWRDFARRLLAETTGLLVEVADSGVEFNGHAGYVVVQIDRDVWDAIQVYRQEKKQEAGSRKQEV